MKKNYLYLAALAMFTAACSNEDEFIQEGIKPSPEVKMITETITASNGDNQSATRAAVDAGAHFSWSEGDQIAVHVSDGSYHTTAGLATGGEEADFTVEYPEGQTRDAFAVFPASIVDADAANYGQSDAALDIGLPASYTLAQVSGDKTPCPMIATNTPGNDWDFKQLCGMLRLTVNGISPSTSYLKIDFNDKKVQGSFFIASPVTPGTSVIETSATDIDDDIITITGISVSEWTDGLVLNLPLPIGTYTDATITTYTSDNKAILTTTAVLAKTGATSYTAERAKGRKATATMPSPITVNASGKKVIFAPGNLQYLGNADGTGTWRFAEHQYDFMGDGPSSTTAHKGNVTVTGYTYYNTTDGKDVARDLFCWGTSGYNGKNPWMTSTTAGDYVNASLTGDNSDYDWGVYHSASGNSTEKIINGGDYSWYLPTQEEWYYLTNDRKKRVYTRTDVPTYTQEKILFAFATVCGVKGLMFFPDNWDGSLDRSIIYGKQSGGTFNNVTCDPAKWAKFEQQGCVFLPAAQVRKGTEVSTSYTGEGHYWSSSINSSNGRGCCLDILSTPGISASTTNARVRYLGQSVRLIREVE